MILFDTETCGFVGPLITIQYAKDDEPIQIYNVWSHTARKTLNLIEQMLSNHLVAYHLSFDAFHLCKAYNTLRRLPPNQTPDIDAVFEAEKLAYDGLCLKPAKVSDLFLILKEYQLPWLNQLKPITIRKVPRESLEWLQPKLNELQLNPLLFSGKASGMRWHIDLHKDRAGNIHKNFLDIKLIFSATVRLKAVTNWLFDMQVIEYGIPPQSIPNEQCPFTTTPTTHNYMPYGLQWKNVIKYHINYWNDKGKPYAEQDVLLLRLLQQWMIGNVPTAKMQPRQIIDIETFHHRNSVLAWQVGACRQHGYPINLDRIEQELNSNKELEQVPLAPREVLKYIHEVATPMQKMVITKTSDDVLAELEKEDGEIGTRAKNVRLARTWNKKKIILQRLRFVGRYHPDFFVLGTQTNRMSGSGGINPQGIDRDIRDIFTFADAGYTLAGGDYDAQELTIAATVYNDQQLFEDLVNDIDVHGYAAQLIYGADAFCKNCKNDPIAKIECNKCAGKGFDKAKRYIGKNKFVFPIFYGSMIDSLIRNIEGSSSAQIKKAWDNFYQRYKGFAKVAQDIDRDYSALVQEYERGNVHWNKPKQTIESIFGYSRNFETEYTLINFLFNIAQDTTQLKDKKGSIERTKDRTQTIAGATSTAFYAAAFGLQSRILRVAKNHIIQAVGAECTKSIQEDIWNIQPVGVHAWVVQPYNVHDEIMTPVVPGFSANQVNDVVQKAIAKLRLTIPLLSMKWKTGLKDWSKK